MFEETITQLYQNLPPEVSFRVLNECAMYFEFLRNSLRNIIMEAEKLNAHSALIASDSFWSAFTAKASGAGKVEGQLWDFKKTLPMWYIESEPDKTKAEIKFSETAASFANARGGVLIIGVTEPPRKIVGVGSNQSELEQRLTYTSRVLAEYIGHADLFHFRQVPATDENARGVLCIAIVIEQAEFAVSVRDKDGRYTFPMRREGGLDRVDPSEIQTRKGDIKHRNSDFLDELARFVYNE